MGNSSPAKLLIESLKNNDNTNIKEIVNKAKEGKEKLNILYDKINNDFTAFEACSFYNAFNCTGTLLELNFEVSALCYFICCERDNIYILKEIVEKRGVCNEEMNSINILDRSIFSCSYRCAYYLHVDLDCKLKEDSFYEYEVNNIRKDFNIKLFIECLRNKTDRTKTPSFYLPTKPKQSLDGKLPDPNESWSSFIGRLMHFRLYQPPMVNKEDLTPEQKKSLYVKMQTGLLNKEFEKDLLAEEIIKSDVEMNNKTSEPNNNKEISLNNENN